MDHELLHIEVDRQNKRVLAVRTGETVTSAAAVQQMIEHARARLADVSRQHFTVRIDLTAAPLAVESRYADAFALLRRELTSGFSRAVFVVETRMGHLQVQRFIREEKLTAEIEYQDAARPT